MNEIKLVVGTASDVGTQRQVNQDAFGTLRRMREDVLLVCDGMGGHAAGEVASRLAVDRILERCSDRLDAEAPERVLADAMVYAHDSIVAEVQHRPDWSGMGTTAVMAVVRGNRVDLCHVGDSRAYLVRRGEVVMLTKDHTRARVMLDMGTLTQEEYENHPDKGVLSQAIGPSSPPEPELGSLYLEPNDVLLLCSDGAYESWRDELLVNLCRGADATAIAKSLVSFSVRNDGSDNTTVTVAIYAPDQPPIQRSQPTLVQPAISAQQGKKTPTLAIAITAVIAMLVGGGLGMWFSASSLDKDSKGTVKESPVSKPKNRKVKNRRRSSEKPRSRKSVQDESPNEVPSKKGGEIKRKSANPPVDEKNKDDDDSIDESANQRGTNAKGRRFQKSTSPPPSRAKKKAEKAPRTNKSKGSGSKRDAAQKAKGRSSTPPPSESKTTKGNGTSKQRSKSGKSKKD